MGHTVLLEKFHHEVSSYFYMSKPNSGNFSKFFVRLLGNYLGNLVADCLPVG